MEWRIWRITSRRSRELGRFVSSGPLCSTIATIVNVDMHDSGELIWRRNSPKHHVLILVFHRQSVRYVFISVFYLQCRVMAFDRITSCTVSNQASIWSFLRVRSYISLISCRHEPRLGRIHELSQEPSFPFDILGHGDWIAMHMGSEEVSLVLNKFLGKGELCGLIDWVNCVWLILSSED